MKNPLALFNLNRKASRRQDIKERVLKNEEVVLDAFSKTVQGTRQCPLLLGHKCLGAACELFVEYDSIVDGKKLTYSKCNFNQTPSLIIENTKATRMVIDELRATQKLLIALYENKDGAK